MYLASCRVIFLSVLFYHVEPSFLWSSPLLGSMHIAVVCYLEISSILHPNQMSKIAQSLVLYSVNYTVSNIWSVTNFLVFYIMPSCNSLYPSQVSHIFKHLGLCFCFYFRVHVSALYILIVVQLKTITRHL